MIQIDRPTASRLYVARPIDTPKSIAAKVAVRGLTIFCIQMLSARLRQVAFEALPEVHLRIGGDDMGRAAREKLNRLRCRASAVAGASGNL